MRNDFMTSIGKIAEVFDGPHATPKKIENGPYFLSISSLDAGKLDLSKSARLSENEFKKWTRRVTPEPGDVLFSYETRLGEAALMPPGIKACLGRRMGLMRPNRTKVIPEYLLYAYLAPRFQGEIRARTVSGCTVNRIALKELPSFPIRVPPLPEQRAIAQILGTLDDKIELNRGMNETLEGMAQGLFKSWFVDFDPVRAKTADSSVQKWIKRGSLLIGDGYRAKRAELGEPGLPFVRAGNLHDNGFKFDNAEILSEASVKAAGEKVSYTNDIAFTSKGTVGRMTLVTSRTRPFVYSPQVCWWRVLDENAINVHVLYRWMKSTAFMDQVSLVKGQTDMADYVSLRDQREMRLTLPPIEKQRQISDQLAAIDEKVAANLSESQTLTTLRDTLLPKLISGDLLVSKAK